MEAFFICTDGQMWTKKDKNRTQNRTQKLPGVYGTLSTGSLLFFFVAEVQRSLYILLLSGASFDTIVHNVWFMRQGGLGALLRYK